MDFTKCILCGEVFEYDHPFYVPEYCPECEDGIDGFCGDYSEMHPDETDEEFWEHED